MHNTDGEVAAYRLHADFVPSKLRDLPWRHQEEARQHLQELDARARALSRAEALRPESADADSVK